jgi:hypothetical protein
MEPSEDGADDYSKHRPTDLVEEQAVDALRAFFEENRERVYSFRQVEIEFESRYFHWITQRALKVLAEDRVVTIEQRTLSYGAPINLVWHKSNRYTRRPINAVLALVEQYSNPSFTAALGNTGELLVSDGFARFGFLQRGRNAREFRGRRWTQTEHNLDFIVERDERVYGIEVKNTLPYIDDKELSIKLKLCSHLEVIPLFVVRAMPAIWTQEVVRRGGFVLQLRYHLYPLSHKALADQVRGELGIPADAPRALYDGTMQRFVSWHEKQLARSRDAFSDQG